MSKPILVTGAAGFIGSAFVQSCRSRGLPVISVDRQSYFDSRTEHRGIDYGQIIDRDALAGQLTALGDLGAIVHLGACTNTMEMDVGYLTRTNLEYSKMLWEHATRSRTPFLYASSAATYGDGSFGYDDEDALIPRLVPLNPYGESKRLFDLWVLDQEKRNATSTPPCWSGFKFFNVYGFGERHKNRMASVVLHAFDQIQAKGRVSLFRSHRAGISDGDQKRDFIHVSDAVNVLHFALEKPIRRGIFNLGTGKARSFLDLTQAVFRSVGAPEKIDFMDTPVELRERYQYFTEARMDRLRAQGYQAPFLSLEAGVQETVRKLLASASRTV